MNTDIVLMVVILALIGADIITGIIKAIIRGSFSSNEMRAGLLRKSGTIILMLLAYGLQYVSGYLDMLPAELGVVYDGVAAYIILMEIASNIENILIINPELGGEKIKRFFGIKGEDNADSGQHEER